MHPLISPRREDAPHELSTREIHHLPSYFSLANLIEFLLLERRKKKELVV